MKKTYPFVFSFAIIASFPEACGMTDIGVIEYIHDNGCSGTSAGGGGSGAVTSASASVGTGGDSGTGGSASASGGGGEMCPDQGTGGADGTGGGCPEPNPDAGAPHVPCDDGYGGAPPGGYYNAGPTCAALYCERGETAYACGEAGHCDAPSASCTPIRGPQHCGHGIDVPTTFCNATAWCCGA